MHACDVVVVGGGPAGAACAWRLGQAGLKVTVVDRCEFPRDKVCAGWITPRVLDTLQIDAREYATTRTLQPVGGFVVGAIGGGPGTRVAYDAPVSFGIRRVEFDEYLLRRSHATVRTGVRVDSLQKQGDDWVVGDVARAPMLVGAGGHFCPVARLLNGGAGGAALVTAQETEVRVADGGWSSRVAAGVPELYFSLDLRGYGWAIRKGEYLNVGFGHVDAPALPQATAAFTDFLKQAGRVGGDLSSWRWRGHAYHVRAGSARHRVGDGVLLAGDAAGLADAHSGEGIWPAVASGLMAASTIVAAGGRYSAGRLREYERALDASFGERQLAHALGHLLPATYPAAVVRRLLATRWFVRHVVLDRWFLHDATSCRRP